MSDDSDVENDGKSFLHLVYNLFVLSFIFSCSPFPFAEDVKAMKRRVQKDTVKRGLPEVTHENKDEFIEKVRHLPADLKQEVLNSIFEEQDPKQKELGESSTGNDQSPSFFAGVFPWPVVLNL